MKLKHMHASTCALHLVLCACLQTNLRLVEFSHCSCEPHFKFVTHIILSKHVTLDQTQTHPIITLVNELHRNLVI